MDKRLMWALPGLRPGALLSAFTLIVAALLACSMPPRSDHPMLYPPAPQGPVVDDYFGTRVADPYRWLEDLDSPRTRSWVTAEGKVTEAYFSTLAVRKALRARLAALYNYEKFGIPFHEAGRYFYTHNTGLQNQSVLYTVGSLSDSPTLAFDPNTLSADGSRAVVGYVASRDGRWLAYGVSISGSDWTEWHLRDVAAGQDLPDVLPFTKYYQPVFARDGRGIYYSAFPAPRQGEELTARDVGNAVYYHELGKPGSRDRKVFEIDGHPDWQFEPHLSNDGRWLVIVAGEGEVGDKGRENIYVVDLASAATTTPVPMVEGFQDAYIYVGEEGGALYFLTTLDAPRGRVIRVDPGSPGRNSWQDVIAQGDEAIDLTETSVTLVDHQLIVRTLHDAHTRVRTYGLDGAVRHEVDLPGPGTARGFQGHPEDRETFYVFSDVITPPTVFRYDLETGTSTLFRSPKVAFEPSSLEEHQVFYTARDGTRIPMLLSYAKGLKPDGGHPVVLYGYGGFGIAVLPAFQASRIAWLERGGIYAIANIRGGGEYGEAWHRQAIRAHKQVVFDDFIAAGEWLIKSGYTSARQLAIQGGSNGGLLVGACLTQRPDLFGAAVASVGVMDMLRFDQFGQGAGWVGDYGSPHDPEDFRALYAYSPVHNVHAGTHYPATLLITGDHDTRVMPMHSFKLAAALQAAQAGPAPVLLYLESSSGHGGGTTVTQAIDQSADIYAFLSANLGATGP